MISQKRICPGCGAANNGMQTHCLLCKTELPPVDRSGITPIASLATRDVPGALPLSELLRRGPLASIGFGCVSILILLGCAGCSLLALRFLVNLR